MGPEGRRIHPEVEESAEPHSRLTKEQLADQIDLMRGDPAMMVQLMQTTLGIDLTGKWGGVPNATIDEIEEKYSSPTEEEHEVINYTADLVWFFCRYSVYEPDELSRRLTWADPDMEGAPLDLIFHDYPHNKINRDKTRQFIDLSAGAVRPPLDERERANYLAVHHSLTAFDRH